MNLIFRFLWVLLSAAFKPRLGALDTSELKFRVLPTDLDFNGHMTNARYLSIMDLGRTDLLLRVASLGALVRARWSPVVGNINIRFRRPLRPFQRFTLKTRLVAWDDKWIFMEQVIESPEGVHSVALLRGLFRGPDGSVPTERLLERFGYQGAAPECPPEAAQWNDDRSVDSIQRAA